MRRAAQILPALAALLLAGACTTPQALAAGDAGDEYSWGMHTGEGRAHLMFGLPDSDVVWFGMSCRTGSGRVQVAQYGSDRRDGPRLMLASGKARQAVPVSREASDLHEEVASAELSASAPVLAAFRSSGRLGVSGAASDGYSAATAAERAEIVRFFTACGG